MVAKTWDEMRAERDRIERIARLGKALARMHALHGTKPGAKCGDCAHLFNHRGDYQGHYFKCHKHGYTNGSATDWRLKWDACGLFERRDSVAVPAGVGSGREDHP